MWQSLSESELLEAIGQRVRALRLAYGLTQAQMATIFPSAAPQDLALV